MDPDVLELVQLVDKAVLGQRIREARLEAGLRQADVAGSLCSTAYLSRIEAGQRRPNPELLEGLAKALGMPVAALVGDATNQDQCGHLRLELDYAELYLASGNPTEALRRSDSVMDALPAANHLLRDVARYVNASALEALGRTADAMDILATLAQNRSNNPEWLRATIALCRCYRELGDFARSIVVGSAAVNHVADLGLESSAEAIQLRVTLAAAHYENGDVGDAVRICQEAVQSAEENGTASARAAAYWNASVIESHGGDVSSAMTLARKALLLFEVEGESRHMARLRSQMGMFQLRLDPPDPTAAAATLQHASVELSATNATLADVARNDLALARARLMLGDLSTSLDRADSVFELTRDGYPLVAVEARMLSGSAYALQGDLEQAKVLARESALLLASIKAERAVAQLWFDLADMLDGLGDHEEAGNAYRRAAVSLGLWRTFAPITEGALAKGNLV